MSDHAAKPPRPGGRRSRCLATTSVVVVVVLVAVILILGFTVFKPKHPISTVDSVSLKNLEVSMGIPKFRVFLNVVIDADLTVNNPNRVKFRYAGGTALLLYRNDVVGVAPIPAGEIPANGATGLNLTLTVMADRLLSNPGIYSDVMSGKLPLTTSTTIPGKVYILGSFKVHVVSETTCDLMINVSNRTIDRSNCRYKTKL
ncbi:uncharacterized protein LOC131164232 [Malania oleifera]|uniref:uncharacterized protein LOC131164232 n=1 Tax=Malania oleifera TaxID=397392 RepID=UPI0025ADEB43|nr:uncharacterized protein LOC131164232 [Malania oleifera]